MSQLYIEVRLYPRAPLTEEEREDVNQRLADPEVEEIEELIPYVIHASLPRDMLSEAKSPKELVGYVVTEVAESMQEVLEIILPAPW